MRVFFYQSSTSDSWAFTEDWCRNIAESLFIPDFSLLCSYSEGFSTWTDVCTVALYAKNILSTSFKASHHRPKGNSLWVASGAYTVRKESFSLSPIPLSIFCHHLSSTEIPGLARVPGGREPPPHQWHEPPHTLVITDGLFNLAALCEEQAACGLNGPADNQGLNTLHAFWKIWSHRCNSGQSIRGDKSRRRTNWGFKCKNAGRWSRGAAAVQGVLVQLEKLKLKIWLSEKRDGSSRGVVTSLLWIPKYLFFFRNCPSWAHSVVWTRGLNLNLRFYRSLLKKQK